VFSVGGSVVCRQVQPGANGEYDRLDFVGDALGAALRARKQLERDFRSAPIFVIQSQNDRVSFFKLANGIHDGRLSFQQGVYPVDDHSLQTHLTVPQFSTIEDQRDFVRHVRLVGEAIFSVILESFTSFLDCLQASSRNEQKVEEARKAFLFGSEARRLFASARADLPNNQQLSDSALSEAMSKLQQCIDYIPMKFFAEREGHKYDIDPFAKHASAPSLR